MEDGDEQHADRLREIDDVGQRGAGEKSAGIGQVAGDGIYALGLGEQVTGMGKDHRVVIHVRHP
jgi:hypothetical protein